MVIEERKQTLRKPRERYLLTARIFAYAFSDWVKLGFPAVKL